MSTIVRDLNCIDTLSGRIDTPARMFETRKTTYRSGLLTQDRQRLNENFRSNIDLENMPAGSRTFGLGSRNTILSSSYSVQNKRSVQESNFVDDLRNVPSQSRTFGLGSRNVTLNSGLSIQNNHELRSNNGLNNMSTLSRTFGLKSGNSTLGGVYFEENVRRLNQDFDEPNYRGEDRSNTSTVSRTFGLVPRSTNMGCGLSIQNNERLNQDMRSLNDNVSTSMMSRPFGLQTRNLTLNSGLHSESNMRLHRESNCKNNDQINISSISRTFGPVARNTTLSAGLQVQDSIRYNDDTMDDGGFRKPTLSRLIRGRNSTMSSRLFSHQNVDRYSKDLSNINGLNVTHISKRGLDTLSESRLALNYRNNWMDNQSVAGSVLSAASMKAQFVNLLENLHHSILNIGPQVTAEAVRMEFDKAKQGLENISEMSFAPSVRETDAASVISHSSKYNCPQIPDQTTINILDRGSFNLKSSKDVLKLLMKNSGNKKEADQSLCETFSYKLRSQVNVMDGEDSSSLFVKPKPKPQIRKRKSLKMLKIKTPKVSKSLASKVTTSMINLKQWYPIAVGSDLAICGVDEEGAIVKTDAVKKRVSNRKLELINGIACNLIGSPSSMVSVLPTKIMNLLKNGLTDRWRMLQKELLICQTAETEVKKRQSKSPIVKSPPRKNEKVSAVHTRSGRTVKPPSSFWLVAGNEEVSSSVIVATPKKVPERKPKKNDKTPEKNGKKTHVASPKKLKAASPAKKIKATDASSKKIQKRSHTSPKKIKTTNDGSPKKNSKSSVESPVRKTRKRSSKVTYEKKANESEIVEEAEEEFKVHSSTEDSKRKDKTRKSPAKRKREITADTDSIQRKRSKLDKKTEQEVESTVEDTQLSTKRKGKKSKVIVSARASMSKLKKSPQTKKGKGSGRRGRKKTVNAVSESKTETNEVNEYEEDFELQLDDIEIPEIANVSGNPQLTRSQLRLVSMETPPLKYFNNNLRLMRSATPLRSPDWCISQRTESEVKQFQRRREEAFRKRFKTVEVKKTVTEKTSNPPQGRDLKRVLDWVADKNVRSPQWNSKLLQYVLPSRKQMEQDDEEEEEDLEAEML